MAPRHDLNRKLRDEVSETIEEKARLGLEPIASYPNCLPAKRPFFKGHEMKELKPQKKRRDGQTTERDGKREREKEERNKRPKVLKHLGSEDRGIRLHYSLDSLDRLSNSCREELLLRPRSRA